jgi:hypothetical protein
MLSSEKFCNTCKIATSRAHIRNTHPSTKPSTNPGAPGAMVYMDIIPAMCRTGLTIGTTFSSYILLVGRYLCKLFLRGLPDKSSASAIHVVAEFQAASAHPFTVTPIEIQTIKADYGSHFTYK